MLGSHKYGVIAVCHFPSYPSSAAADAAGDGSALAGAGASGVASCVAAGDDWDAGVVSGAGVILCAKTTPGTTDNASAPNNAHQNLLATYRIPVFYGSKLSQLYAREVAQVIRQLQMRGGTGILQLREHARANMRLDSLERYETSVVHRRGDGWKSPH